MDEPTKSDPPLQKNPGGGQRGNLNAVRHGLTAGKLPQGLAYVEKKINLFRRRLEAAVEEVKGEIAIGDAAAINSVCKWERHAMLALHWLRKEGDKLSASDKLKFSEAIAKASDARDRALAKLRLDVQDLSPWVIDAKG